MRTQGVVEIAVETKSIEVLCQKKRIQFLSSLKTHFNLLKMLCAEHKKLLDRMCILSTKLNVFESDVRPDHLPYTKELIWRVKGEILNSLNSIASKINRNLQQLTSSFITLRQNHEEFILSSKAIDWNNASRLNTGSATEKPLFYYVDHSIDIMYCLDVHEKTTHFNKSHLNVRDTNSITKFLNEFLLPQNFHDLIADVLLNSFFIEKAEKMRNKS